ncbi:MAG: alpha/beta hydrolase [Propionibacteriaceae bacterium]|jgi:alpha-beta hydrolase superfamily lysophospholipase|nr:alpha/beta hydrolase [Propionibacteriaceae bacterium]
MEPKTARFDPAALISGWRFVTGRSSDDAASDPTVDLSTDHHQSGWWAPTWAPDRLLEGYQTLTYDMPDRPHHADEGDGHLIATLIRHHPPRQRRAVLYIHGWNEYFFQAHVARAFEELGYDFYAIDLHRYGRSLQPGEMPGYMESVEEYFPELDACVERIRDDHSQILLHGHSTGGLIASLYAADRPKTFVGVVLNSPWIDMQGSALFRALTPPIMRGLAVASPTMALPMSENELYGRSLHKDFCGEWDYDLSLKRVDSQPIRPGWTRAVVNGHDRVGAGLHIDCPVLVLTSARSSAPKQWCDDVMTSDLALDVDRIAARAHLLGWHVTLVRLSDGLHDLSLSRADVRERYFDEIRRWDLAYVRVRAWQDRVSRDLDQ